MDWSSDNLVIKSTVFFVLILFSMQIAASQGYGGLDYKESRDRETYETVSNDWNYSQRINFSKRWDGERNWGGPHRLYTVQLNTKKLISEGKMREDCKDIRVASNGKLAGTRIQSPTCNTTETWVYFSNFATAFGTQFDSEKKIEQIEVFYGNLDEGISNYRVSEYNRNLATTIRPESAIEMYYGSHDNTWVDHSSDGDPHLHYNDQSAPEQKWHIDFQHDHGDQPTEHIHIEDEDGNSVARDTDDDYVIDSGNVPSWVQQGEEITVYFESQYNDYGSDGTTYSDTKSAVWGQSNRAPNEPNNPDPAQSTGTSPVYTTSPMLNVDVSDPDSSDDLDVDFISGISETWNFDTCGSTGSSGPSQTQCDSSYSGTTLGGEVNVVNPGIQEWTVPRDGTYRIRAAGASGGLGDGSVIQGTFSLNQGQTIQVLVGQQPSYDGGAGGTFVAQGNSHTSANPLVVAGGGAGGDQSYQTYTDGSDSTPGQDSQNANGGNNGYGGGSGDGGGGGGFYGDGSDGSAGGGGSAFQNGGTGATNGDSIGGFGGGGAAESGGDEAGGAGGYSGGAGADDGTNNGENEIASGGGSFIDSSAISGATHTGNFDDSSTNDNGYSGSVNDLGGMNSGQGYVVIEAQGQQIGEDNNVNNGNTASFEWSGLTEGQSYDWSARACDPEGECATSSIFTFEVSQGPRKPDNPNPSDTSTVSASSGDVDLSARYRHTQGTSAEPGTLTFYNQDGSEIGSCQADHNERCSVTKSISNGNRYDWYVVAQYGDQTATSDPWYFRANTPPEQATNPNPSEGSEHIDYNSRTLSAYVEDADGDDMDVTFSGGSASDSFSQTTSVSGSGTASVTVNNMAEGEVYDWSVTAEDEHGSSTTSDTWSFTTNYLPTIQDPEPADGEYVSTDEVELSISVSDNDGDQTDVRIYDENGNLLSNGATNDGSQKTFTADYDSLSFGQTYDWTVEANDAYGTNSKTFSFSVIGGGSFRPVTGIEYDYSSVIKSSSQARFIEYEVTNRNTNEKELQTTLTGPESQFRQYGSDSHTYTLQPGETKSFSIEIYEDSIGDYTLDVTTEDLRLGVQNKDSIPVVVRDFPASAVERAPGLMWIQVLLLAAGATVLYSVRL